MARQLRAAIYARVSSEEQRDNSSLADQVARARAAATARNWWVVAEHREDFTGTVRDRPQWTSLLEACEAGDIDVVVTLKWDRIARDAGVGLEIAGRLEDLGVALVVLDADFDTTTLSGKLMRHMMLGFAEFDRNQLVERMARGQHAMAARGGWPSGGASAYGYRVVGGGSNNRLAVDEAEAKIVRMVVSWIVDEGLTTGQATRRLNDMGIGTRKQREWTHQNLRRILSQRVLLGEFTWGNTAKTHRGYRPTGKYGPPVDLQFDPILDPSRFADLQLALGRTSRPNRKGNQVYPLSGRMHSPCGDHYGGVCNHDRRQYRCRRAKWTATSQQRCGDVVIDADEVETRVWEAVSALLRDPDRILALAHDYLGLGRQEIGVERDEVALTKSTIHRLEKAQRDTLPDLARRGLDADAIHEAMTGISRDLTTARTRLAELERRRANSRAESTRVRDAWGLAEGAAGRLDSMSLSERAEAVRLLDVQVWVLDEGKRPALHVEGTLCHEHLLPTLEPRDLDVVGTPRHAPPPRRSGTGACARPP